MALRLEIDDALASPAGVTTADATQARRRTSHSGGHRRNRRRRQPHRCAGHVGPDATGTACARVPGTVHHHVPTDGADGAHAGGTRDLASLPDGRYLAYQSRGRLMLRALDQLDGVLLSSVSGGHTPFFSPDSRWIGFFEGGDLRKVAVTGEPVITLSRELGSLEGGTWGDDGTIVVSSDDGNVGLRRVSADGGEATVLTKTDAAQPGPLHSVDAARRPRRDLHNRGRTVQNLQLAVLDLKSGQQKTLIRGGVAGEYLETGHLLYSTYSRGADQRMFGTLWVVPFDLDRLALQGEPVRVSETLQVHMMDGANYVVSRTGALAYVPAFAQARSFVWVDRAGRETAIDALPPRPYDTIGLSRDGTRLAFTVLDRELDIWTWDFARESLTRLTFGSSLSFFRDGRPTAGELSSSRIATDRPTCTVSRPTGPVRSSD